MPALLAVALLAALPAAAAERNDGNAGTRLLRYPDVSASDIAFVYGGDLYLSIGVFTSVFTAIIITQVLIGWWFKIAKPKKLPIA